MRAEIKGGGGEIWSGLTVGAESPTVAMGSNPLRNG